MNKTNTQRLSDLKLFITAWERFLARNARRVARQLLTGYPVEEIQAAKQIYARYSIEELNREIAGLLKCS